MTQELRLKNEMSKKWHHIKIWDESNHSVWTKLTFEWDREMSLAKSKHHCYKLKYPVFDKCHINNLASTVVRQEGQCIGHA